MTPEAGHFLTKARDQLRQAEVMMGVALHEAAGRAAYLAGFHAAQAFLFETTGKVFKTHKGIQAEFGRATKGDPRFDPATRAFLGRTYDLKAIADYVTGPGSEVTLGQAAEAITTAQRYVSCLSALLEESQ